jgi:hypothetical protein
MILEFFNFLIIKFQIKKDDNTFRNRIRKTKKHY